MYLQRVSSMVKRIQRKLALPIQTSKQSWISTATAAHSASVATIAAAVADTQRVGLITELK